MAVRNVFNLFGGRLPRAIAGAQIDAKDVDTGWRSTERSKPITGFNTRRATIQLPNGFAERHALFPVNIGYVTTAITKRVGGSYGQGVVSSVYDTGTALDPLGDAITVKNYHTVGFATTYYVGYFEAAGSFWAFDIDNCAGLTT